MSEDSRTQFSRRSFVLSTLTATGALAATGAWPERLAKAGEPAALPAGGVILFQGDSITDAGRDRKAVGPNEPGGLGRGYPSMIAGALFADYPQLQLKVFNRGISGNKVPDLASRWEEDALALRPTLLSILIGVNDIWHKLNGRYTGTVGDYETGYRALLQRTREKIPGLRLVVCEPFVLRCGSVADNWFPEFDERRAVAKKLAEELRLTFVPFQSMYDAATQHAPPAYWAPDGVHPSLAGHALMAKTWRSVVSI